jgi:hypothetical protein
MKMKNFYKIKDLNLNLTNLISDLNITNNNLIQKILENEKLNINLIMYCDYFLFQLLCFKF